MVQGEALIERAAVDTQVAPGARTYGWWVDLALWLGVWAPFVVVAAVRAQIDWFPVQDQAVLDMRVRGLLHGHDIPLVGAFSRFGWSHPGPLWFYVLAPFRALGGTDGMLAGSILLFGAGIATLPVLVRRRYGVGATVVALIALVPALMAAGTFTLLIPWNPHLAFAWLPVFLVLTLSAIDRRPEDLGPAVFVGAMLIQLHVGYVVIAALPITFVMAVIVRRHGLAELGNRAARGNRWLTATLILYIPPVLQQIEHGIYGNFGKLAKFFIAPPARLGHHAGLAFGAGTLGGVLRVPLTGLGGSGERADQFTGYLVPDPAWRILPLIAAVVAAYAIARRSRSRAARDAVLFAGVVLVVGLIALSGLVGERWSYIFAWRFVVIWFVVAVVVIAVAAAWRSFRPAREAARAGERVSNASWLVLAVAVAVLGYAVVAKAVTAPYGQIIPYERATQRLANAVLATSRPNVPVELVHFDGSLLGVADGLMNKLDLEGWRVGAPKLLAYKYGDSHAISDNSPHETWFVSETSLGTTLAAVVPHARVVATVTPLSRSEDRELSRLQLALVARLRATKHLDLLSAVDFNLADLALAGRVDTTGIDVHHLARLNDKVSRSGICRCAITVVPRGTADDLPTLASSLPDNALVGRAN